MIPVEVNDDPTYESDLRRVRNYHILTTAALPSLILDDNTAVNPLLRAAHFLRRNREMQQAYHILVNLNKAKTIEEDSTSSSPQCEQQQLHRNIIEIPPSSPIKNISLSHDVVTGIYSHKQVSKPKQADDKDDNTMVAPVTPTTTSSQTTSHEDPEPSVSSDECDNIPLTLVDDVRSEIEFIHKFRPQSSSFSLSSSSSSSSSSSLSWSSSTSLSWSSSSSKMSSSSSSLTLLDTSEENKNDHEVDTFEEKELPRFHQYVLFPPILSSKARTRRDGQEEEEEYNNLTNEERNNQSSAGIVTLVVPWLFDACDQRKLFGTTTPEDGSIAIETDEKSTKGATKTSTNRTNSLSIFTNHEEQETYIRSWLANEAGMPDEARALNIIFYPARYHKHQNSIFALSDICDLIPDEIADVCILEDPDHLNWYRAPGRISWREKFVYCVGIIHTNSPPLASINRHAILQANCHRVIKLSNSSPELAPMIECVSNVNGVRDVYLMEGERRKMAVSISKFVTRGNTKLRWVYMIGKLQWAGGFHQLLDLQEAFRECTGYYFEIDVFGAGPDEREIKRAFSGNDAQSDDIFSWCRSKFRRRPCLPVRFMGKKEHTSLAGDDYSIFVNPSLTDMLDMWSAEAVAMGKWAILPKHPSTAFFEQFPNCRLYRTRQEFVANLQYALMNDPPTLSDKRASLLTWEAATTRCINSTAIYEREA